jgi:diguanylate cyclase (GGDEF)-like protein/PAS domain S-box-containing protein
MDNITRPREVAAEMERLKQARDEALRAARSAVRDASRVNRLLTVLSEPAPIESLLEKILNTVSELFSADIVVLLDPAGSGNYFPVASVGLPDGYVFEAGSQDEIALLFKAHREGVVLDPEMIRKNPIFNKLSRLLGVEAAVWIPMKGSRKLRGAIVLARCLKSPFTYEEIGLLNAMAYRIALTLEQVQNKNQLEHIITGNQKISRHLEKSAIEEEAIKTFPVIVNADNAVLFRCRDEYHLICASDPDKIGKKTWEWLLFPKYLSKDPAILKGEAVSITAFDQSRFPCQSPDFPYRAVLAAPILGNGQLQSLLCAFRSNAIDFTMQTKQIATLYSVQIAVALESAHLYGLLRDELRERRSIEKNLRESEERFKALVRNISDVIAVLNPDGTIKYVGEAAKSSWGQTPEELAGTTLFDRTHPDDLETIASAIEDSLGKPGENISVVARMYKGDPDSWRYFDVILNNSLHDTSVKGIVTTFHDVTERKIFEKELTELAFRDPLTELSNRANFFDHVRFALTRAAERNTSAAIIFFDLDNFKNINDTFGHAAGDEILCTVAKKIKGCLRSNDTAARLGGDEFTILIEDVKNINSLHFILDRLLPALVEPMWVNGIEVKVGASIGIALSTLNDDAESLLHKADLAMYRAKRTGKGRYVVFDPSFEENLQQVEKSIVFP